MPFSSYSWSTFQHSHFPGGLTLSHPDVTKKEGGGGNREGLVRVRGLIREGLIREGLVREEVYLRGGLLERGLLRDRAYQGGGLSERALYQKGGLLEMGHNRSLKL